MESIETVVLDTDVLIDHLRGFTKAKIFLALFDEKSISGMISTLKERILEVWNEYFSH